jgi:hypothetical protein
MRIIGSTAAPRIAALLLNAVSFMVVFLFVGSGAAAARTWDDGKDSTLCHRGTGRSYSERTRVPEHARRARAPDTLAPVRYFFFLLLAVFAVAAPAQRQKKTDVQVLDVKSRRSEDKIAFDGKMRVTGDKPLKGLVLEFAFLSASGDVLTTQKTEVSDETLNKDDEPAFHVETLNPPGAIQYRIRAFDSTERELRLVNAGPFIIE